MEELQSVGQQLRRCKLTKVGRTNVKDTIHANQADPKLIDLLDRVLLQE